MKKIVLLVVTMSLIFVMAACGTDVETADNDEVSVKISITYPENSDMQNVVEETIIVDKGESVLDVLEEYADEKDFVIAVDTASTPYVTSINGVAASGSSGWIYQVNGNQVMDPADSYKAVSGETYQWIYTTW